ncbi:MAG: glycosyltransferase [Planctomycetota bacterium]
MTTVVYAEVFGGSSEVWLHRQVTALGVPLITHDHQNADQFPYKRAHVIPMRRTWTDRGFGILRDLNEQHPYHLPVSTERRVRDTLCDLGADCVHAHFGPAGILMVPIVRRLACRLVVTFHGFDVGMLPKEVPSYTRALSLLWRQVNHVVAVSEHVRDRLLELGCPEDRVEVVRLGVPLRPLRPRSATDRGPVRVLTVARLTAKKGVPDLVSAVARARADGASLELDILGDGPERSLVEARIKAERVEDAVTLHGLLPPAEVEARLDAADIFVLNSRAGPTGDMEGLPISLLEAMAAGLCVVSTRHSGIPEAVKHERTGILVDEHDTDALARAMATLAEDPGLRIGLGAAGRVRVESDFDPQKGVARLREIYAG